MLYLIHRQNQELAYQGGQDPIVHLECDLLEAVKWANSNNLRWAFSLSNAGAFYFEDRADLAKLDDIDWNAVNNNQWGGNPTIKEGKQAEFLMEDRFSWDLVENIGIIPSQNVATLVSKTLATAVHKPPITFKPNWYY